ncbi:POC1 centriolar protein A [Ceratobasidium sp. 395]|nr:POC1 centriolar protein A [Ceratobasidium sp. 395]
MDGDTESEEVPAYRSYTPFESTQDAAGMETPISQSTPQIYVSALQFWSRTGPISECYRPRLRSLVNATEEWPTKQARSIIISDHAVQAASGTDIDDLSNPDSLLQDNVAQPPDGHTSIVSSVAYFADGSYIVSGSYDNTIRIWDARTGKPVGLLLTGHTGGVLSVAYSPDGAYIASSSQDNTIRIWDARTGKPVGRPLTGHTSSVLSVAYSPDGGYIASGSFDETIRIWDARTGKPVGQPLTGHTSSVWSVAYSPDGAYIASGSRDNTIRIWDARTGKPVGQPLTGHTHLVFSVAYSPDGAYIASGSDDCTIRIWDARTGEPVGQPLTGHTHFVNSVAYSPGGAYIASGSADSTIRIWDARTGKPVGQPLTGHTDPVCSVAYSPDGAYIVSGSYDNTIRIWFAPTWPAPKPVQPSTPSRRPATEPFRRSFWTVLKFTNQTTRRSRPSHTYKGDNELKQQAAAIPPITASPHDWTLNEDGWVVGPSKERLLWVPPDLRGKVAPPRTKTIISAQPRFAFDFREAKLGLNWQDCYKHS